MTTAVIELQLIKIFAVDKDICRVGCKYLYQRFVVGAKCELARIEIQVELSDSKNYGKSLLLNLTVVPNTEYTVLLVITKG